jgi:hypothetical protein
MSDRSKNQELLMYEESYSHKLNHDASFYTFQIPDGWTGSIDFFITTHMLDFPYSTIV